MIFLIIQNRQVALAAIFAHCLLRQQIIAPVLLYISSELATVTLTLRKPDTTYLTLPSHAFIPFSTQAGEEMNWVQRKIYLYNVTFGLYMLDWWERCTFNILVIVLMCFVLRYVTQILKSLISVSPFRLLVHNHCSIANNCCCGHDGLHCCYGTLKDCLYPNINQHINFPKPLVFPAVGFSVIVLLVTIVILSKLLYKLDYVVAILLQKDIKNITEVHFVKFAIFAKVMSTILSPSLFTQYTHPLEAQRLNHTHNKHHGCIRVCRNHHDYNQVPRHDRLKFTLQRRLPKPPLV
ncbi:hypothetical protein VNO78_02978 [Psophocarpus tetragonolobus]|uniref:Uncharacterized protein n=1 Tax=Psophocarpus tetragonolobus TaxID=3891 RepID=A0AAN9T0B8_PSOTE